MSEKEIEEWCDKIISGELPNVAYLTEEEKERIKAFVDNLGEAFEKIAEYLENVFIPAFEDFFKALWDTPNAYNSKRSQQVIKRIMAENRKPRPLYLDKRRKVHICRSNC